ncbi:sensor histidine kinase [Bacillus sp. HNG]|uniref:sensor histidine kinase n=1 Tax=Bacillus sp. HNG TaxID=2293325 RepID=UPI000E2EFE36|nr:histidine kinase [Bacillus sp. HNG]RFB17437.1 sensor histidine kinase [Bacillus sp. HNG]
MNSENYTLKHFISNKLQRFRYVSYRVGWYFFFVFTFLLVFLISLTVIAFQETILFYFVILGYVTVAIMVYVLYKWIIHPYRRQSKILHLFVNGYTINDLFEQSVSLSPETEEVTKKVEEFLAKGELLNATKKQAQYLALQNQINPHFLYNTLEGIRGETLNAGLKNVAKMTEALATFFRYTISNVENLVTVEDEIININNYYIIQRYRFNERIDLSVEYDEFNILMYTIPKLTLQPIVENAIHHGIERSIGKGMVRIKIEQTAKRLIITISDNGIGMPEERLQELNDKLINTSLDYIQSNDKSNGGIAMLNVNNRIKLLFGEEYGICVYSALNVGTDVEITLPLITK